MKSFITIDCPDLNYPRILRCINLYFRIEYCFARLPSTMSFFQIILSSTLHEGELEIPEKFVYEYGNEFYDSVTLSVPTGRCWDVGVARETDNSIWLHDGMFKFMKDNSIEVDYFLSFKLKGNSKFVVKIFDLTATEIIYTCIVESERWSGVNQPQTAEVGDGGGETLNSENGGNIESNDNSIESASPKDDNSIESASTNKQCFDVSHETNHIKPSCLKRRKRQILEGGSGAQGDGSCNFPEECAEERATGTQNTMCFEVIMKPWNTISLIVPSDFARMNMPGSSMFIKLLDEDDNEWEVRYTYHKHYHNLNKGWRNFVMDKKLMSGDVCAFELIKNNEEINLKVNIKRSQDSPQGDGIECAEEQTSSPFFEATIELYNIKKNVLHVPVKFSSSHKPCARSLIKLVDSEDNEWEVNYVRYDTKYFLAKGWKSFVQDKKLMVGDVCVFELIKNNEEINLKVNIKRSQDLPQGDGIQCAEDQTSSPFFEVTIKLHNIKRNDLYVPAKFSRSHMPCSETLIKLVDSEDNEWEVKYFRYNTRYFLIGWKCFVKDKKLMVGDVCDFERIYGCEEVKLKVNISRVVEDADRVFL